jgi:hypothetical protein
MASTAEYEELRARFLTATQTHHEPLTPQQSHTPIGPERDMDTENNQNTSSSSDGLQNGNNGAMAEFEGVVAAYNVSPSVVNDARTFVQVRTPYFPHHTIL